MAAGATRKLMGYYFASILPSSPPLCLDTGGCTSPSQTTYNRTHHAPSTQRSSPSVCMQSSITCGHTDMMQRVYSAHAAYVCLKQAQEGYVRIYTVRCYRHCRQGWGRPTMLCIHVYTCVSTCLHPQRTHLGPSSLHFQRLR